MKKSFDKGFLTPYPVFIVASYDEQGKANAMNAAWGGQCGDKQVSICMSHHRTTDNLEKTKAFTISFATIEQAAACDFVGMVSQDKVPDKMEKCGWTFTKSDKVNAPIIDQLPVAIECKLVEIQHEFGDLRIVGEIVGMKADDSVLTDGKVDLGKLKPIMFDGAQLCYRSIGDSIGKAWGIGKQFM